VLFRWIGRILYIWPGMRLFLLSDHGNAYPATNYRS
jgi:hypothetical protein